jgi:Rrf2 family transcriptional regulator, cysteine metabolism repressor
MRLSSKEQTGLRAMIEFARCHGNGPTALSEVAQAQDLPLPYLERVAAELRRAGLLTSVRGARGGYYLAREPGQIRVSDVFRALEGQLISVDCMGPDGSSCCDREATCEARNVWQSLQDCLTDTLDNMTLADVI